MKKDKEITCVPKGRATEPMRRATTMRRAATMRRARSKEAQRGPTQCIAPAMSVATLCQSVAQEKGTAQLLETSKKIPYTKFIDQRSPPK